MNVSYKWLKEYVDFDLTPQETADALTSCGLEVDALEEVQSVKGGLKGLYVGKVLTCEEHPNSDHLHVTTVDLGKGEPQQIVCGAPNVAAGQKVIVADLGCVLYDGDQSFTIKKSKLRGVESLGMICAEDEIGVGTSHDGIIVLPEDAPVGQPAAEYYHLESDWLIEIDITANRADALGHWGVARDLYAWLKQNGYKTSLHRPSCDEFVVDNEDLPIDVEIQNTEACKRYACVSITGCEVKESPKWLQDKLNIIGLRPINNIVDITNYIMMAYGQPLHCFDADMVTGHKIVVRTQPEGTKFVTLDGEEHTLGEHDLSICNAEEPMCIAGIFGGKGSGTYETTKDVVLESAYFHPTWIRKSARRHGLSTDASYRFERGVDPNGQIYALKQAAILCKQLAGGKISMQIKDVYPEPMQDFPVRLNYEYAHRLIGKEIGAETIKNIATSLEMKIVKEDAEGIDLLVPAYRVDVQRPCDVVEDILRIYGYNNVEIPTQLKSSLTVQNLKFFEVGNTYIYNKEKWSEESPIKAYSQEAHMSLFITGKRVEGSWAHADEQSNIYELKAVVENVLRRVGMPQNNVVIKHSDNNIFSKGVSYETRAGKVLVELGILSLKLKKAFDIEQDVFYADIHWDNLMKAVKKVNLTYTDISKYPSVSRDLALLVDKNVEFAQIEQIAHQTEKKLLKSVVLFDVYEGEHLPEGKKSYAVNFILQDEEKTLNDKQIDAIMKKLIANLTSKLNAELR